MPRQAESLNTMNMNITPAVTVTVTHTHADALPHPYVQARILSYINVRQGSISAPLSVLFVLAYYQIQWQVAKAFFGQLKFTWHTHTLVI